MARVRPSEPLSAVPGVVAASLRQARPLWVVGEASEPRPGRDGAVWVTLEDETDAVDVWVPSTAILDAGRAFAAGCQVQAHVEVAAQASRASWYLRADHLDVLAGTGPLTRQRRANIELLVRDKVIPKDKSTNFAFDRIGNASLWPAISKVVVFSNREHAAWGDFYARTSWLVDAGTIEVRDVPLQGHGMPEGLIEQLDSLDAEEVDLAFIIRGGGTRLDLRGFDDPTLARAIHRCPVNVITAVGHARDISLADRAAFAAFETPSNAASAVVKAHYEHRGRTPTRRRSSRAGTPNLTVPDLTYGDGYLQQQLARANEQTANLQTKLTITETGARATWRAYQELRQFTDGLLISGAAERVRRRSRWLGSAAAVMTLIVLWGSWRWWWTATPERSFQPRGYVSAIALILLAAATVYLFQGPRRAAKPPTQRAKRRLPSTGDEWVRRAQLARTPRELRLLRHARPQ